MSSFNLSIVNGHLLFVGKSGIIGYDPAISNALVSPKCDDKKVDKTENIVSFDGEVFRVIIRNRKRKGYFDLQVIGYEVYAGNELLTTYIEVMKVGGPTEYGSQEFQYKNKHYLIAGGQNSFSIFGNYIGFDYGLKNEIRIAKYLYLKSNKTYLYRFDQFMGEVIKFPVRTFEDILNETFKKKSPYTPHIAETWGMKDTIK